MSIGGPAAERQKTPLELRRDEDLTRDVARGRADARETPDSPRPPPSAAAARPQVARATPTRAPERPAATSLEGPPAPAPLRSAPTASQPSIAGSLRNLEERLAAEGPRGLSSGTGQQMGPLFFDPQGADFTAWYNHFKNEVFRNWIVPPSVSFGARGHVDIAFVVERDGRLSEMRVLRSSGTPALDRAARNALLGSRLLPLPDDFRPARMPVEVSFFYNAVAGS